MLRNWNMEKIKFSIVIPTRERADTLSHSIATCTAQDYENLDIIVSDNFSQDNTREVVYAFTDPRIKYINTGKRVSMSHNWEFALSHITDGWVTFLGDDDGLLPGALSTVADTINRTGCQAITSRMCTYFWPNSGARYINWHSWPISGSVDNNLTIPLTSGIELRGGREWLGKLMRGDAEYFDLPRLYVGGFVDIRAVNRARGSSGAFFLSMTPDVYSAIALATVLDNYVILKEPVSIGGSSAHSIGASGLGFRTSSAVVEEFLSEENIPFHSMLAGGERMKSIPVVVYESYLQAIHLHHDFLKIDLADQIALALSRIVPQHYADLRKYCSQVARNNKIEMDVVDRKTKNLKRRLFFQQLKTVVKLIIGELPFSGNKNFRIKDAREFGVRDISGAALLAKAVFLLETRYINWKFDNFFQSMKKYLRNVTLEIRQSV